jgi:hypothetical protein
MFLSKDIEMSQKHLVFTLSPKRDVVMLYRQEKLCFERCRDYPCYNQILHFPYFLFRWFASTIKIYSKHCPWLLIGQNLRNNLMRIEKGSMMPVQTRKVSQLVICRVVGMTWIIDVALVSASMCWTCQAWHYGRINHVTTVRLFIRYCNGWCISAYQLGYVFTTYWSWDCELWCISGILDGKFRIPTRD